MTAELHLAGPTVTLFGDRDSLDAALNTELGRRGCSTHTVTTPTGWLASATHVILRLDSRAGVRAIEELAEHQSPAAHVVVVRTTSLEESSSTRLDGLCRDSSRHHDVSVIRHAPLVPEAIDDTTPTPAELAVAIVDEIGHQVAWTTAPSFTTKDFEPSRHRA